MPSPKKNIAILLPIQDWVYFLQELSSALLPKEHPFPQWVREKRSLLKNKLNELGLKSESSITIEELITEFFKDFTTQYAAIPADTPALQLLTEACAVFESFITAEGLEKTELDLRKSVCDHLNKLHVKFQQSIVQSSLSLAEINTLYPIAIMYTYLNKNKEAVTILETILPQLMAISSNSDHVSAQESVLLLIKVEQTLGDAQINLRQFQEASKTFSDNLKRQEAYFKNEPHSLIGHALYALGYVMGSLSLKPESQNFFNRALKMQVALCMAKAETDSKRVPKEIPEEKFACAAAFEKETGVSLNNPALSGLSELRDVLLTLAEFSEDKQKGLFFLQAAEYLAEQDREMNLVSSAELASIYGMLAKFIENPEENIKNLKKAIALLEESEGDHSISLISHLINLNQSYALRYVREKKSEDFEIAKAILERALKLCPGVESAESTNWLLTIYGNFAGLYERAQLYPKVLFFIERSLMVFMQLLSNPQALHNITRKQRDNMIHDVYKLKYFYSQCHFTFTEALWMQKIRCGPLVQLNKETVKALILSREQEQALHEATALKTRALTLGKDGIPVYQQAISRLKPYLTLPLPADFPLLKVIAEAMSSFYYQLGSTYAELNEWALAIPPLEEARSIRLTIGAEQTLIDRVAAELTLCKRKQTETEEQKTLDVREPDLPTLML